MGFIDRILTIVITATITSVIWIVAGGSIIENASSKKGEESLRPAEAAPSPEASESPQAEASLAERADELRPGQFVVPVMNVRPSDLTDTFTDSMGGGARLHEALDIMAPEGTSVVAAAPGTIERLFVSDASGNTIYVRSNDRRTIHYYAHLGEYAEGLTEGQRISRGQRLGTVGASGKPLPNVPHLHFAILQTTEDAEWWEPANALNPYPLLTGN